MDTTKDKINEGLAGLLGQKVLLLCMNYFYWGTLEAISETEVKLSDPYIIYGTGEWLDDNWGDSQSLGPDPHYVRVSALESYRKADKNG
jgi:hypothetical protein